MENSKLMIPLFCGGNFNRDGRKIRAVFEREISNGEATYRLWRRDGKPNQEYPRAENDRYLLYAEVNGYLLPLKMTDCFLIDRCGFMAAVKKLYGNMELRGQYFDSLRKSAGDPGVLTALETESKEIQRYGSDPARQADYIHRMLSERVRIYLGAKENEGETFPDFIGALILDDLPKCVALSEIYKAKQNEEEAARLARIEQEQRKYCEQQNQKFEQAISEAIQAIRTGGFLKNDTVEYYRSRYDSSSYSILNYLFRLYQIDVPLRTQGWINNKLSDVTIRDGKCSELHYLRKKNGRGSQKFFQYMNRLVQAVIEQVPEDLAGGKSA